MANKDEKKKKTEGEITLVIPVSKSFVNSRSSGDLGEAFISGNTRIHPTFQTEVGTEMRCMTCGYQAPEYSFQSENQLSFEGCPECKNIDHSKFIAYNEEGLIGMNKTRTNPENYSSKPFDKIDNVDYGPHRPPNKEDVLKYKKAIKERFNKGI